MKTLLTSMIIGLLLTVTACTKDSTKKVDVIDTKPKTESSTVVTKTAINPTSTTVATTSSTTTTVTK